MITIFAPITSGFRCGISVIRISGPQTAQCLAALGFKRELQHQKIYFDRIFDQQSQELIDEVLISFFQSPHSFTGENCAEISIHASPFILTRVLEILSEVENCRIADAGEFSKRAFLNGKMDLVQAEAIPDLIASETAVQHRQALRQLQGKLGEIYENWRFRLVEISAMIEAAIDFPDEDLPKNIIADVEEKVEKLRVEIIKHLDDKNIGQKIKQGLSLAIIGAPNAGKSSLINFLAQSDIAIVSEFAGTTRDVVETHLSIAGIAVRVCDTAGIRITDDKIEMEGIRRALQKAAEADLKIFVIDAENPILRPDLIDENTIVVINKTDLASAQSIEVVPNAPIVEVSLVNNTSTDELIRKLEEKINELVPQQSSPIITQERYRVALKNAAENLENFTLNKNIELAAEDLRMTAREIGKITGKVDVENILDVIFSRFCIGK